MGRVSVKFLQQGRGQVDHKIHDKVTDDVVEKMTKRLVSKIVGMACEGVGKVALGVTMDAEMAEAFPVGTVVAVMGMIFQIFSFGMDMADPGYNDYTATRSTRADSVYASMYGVSTQQLAVASALQGERRVPRRVEGGVEGLKPPGAHRVHPDLPRHSRPALSRP